MKDPKMICFTKDPNFYDALGCPHYISRCGKYDILYVRTGRVKRDGSTKYKDYYCQFQPGFKFSCPAGIGNAKTKTKAIKICRKHSFRVKQKKRSKK